MNKTTRFEEWRRQGVTPQDARSYAEWLTNKELPLKKADWIPTPMPVAYWGKDMQIIRLPFLDLSKKSYVLGVACGPICYQAKWLTDEVYRYGMISVANTLKELRGRYYPAGKNVIGRIFSSEGVYARDFIIPTLDEMQRAYMHKDAMDDTLWILQANGIDADLWDDGDFICRDDNDTTHFHQVIDFAAGVVKDYAGPQQNGGKTMKARAAVKVNDYDPEYPMTNIGKKYVFDWSLWRKCESEF